MGWRYIASRLNGDGTETFLNWELPLSGVSLTNTLSGPDAITASIDSEVATLKVGGLPLIEPWSTAIYAEIDGQIRCGAIVTDMTADGPSLGLDCIGFPGYAYDMPYTSEYSRVQIDPLDVVRDIWTHIQSKRNGNIGLTVDSLTTGLKLGKPGIAAYGQVFLDGKWINRTDAPAGSIEPEAFSELAVAITAAATSLTLTKIDKFDQLVAPYDITITSETITVGARSGLVLSSLTRGVGTSVAASHGTGANVKHAATLARTIAAIPAEPVKLMWYQTHNLGGEIDSLAKATPFEYREAHVWSGDTINHKLRLGYPAIGRRRHDLRFVVGENIQIVPSIDFGTDYASEALVLGAGTGRKMIRGSSGRPDSRLRRVAVVSKASLTSTTKANTLAKQEVLRRLGLADVTEVTILDHPHAPLGSFDVGDEILVQTGSGWADDVALWCRVVSMTISPDSLGVARLSILRTDRITA